MTHAALEDLVQRAGERVAPCWPIHAFVTVNPLKGFEDRPFHEAVAAGERVFGARGYPAARVLRAAWQRGEIDPERLDAEFAAVGRRDPPEVLLDELASREHEPAKSRTGPGAEVDRILVKYLTAFLEEGQTGFPMPHRDAGFYAAFRRLAPHDSMIPGREALAALPEDPLTALHELLEPHPRDRWERVLVHELFALPGWAGFIRQRAASGSAWQERYPITLIDYLAVRLALTERLGAPSVPDDEGDVLQPDPAARAPVEEAFLRAWEATCRSPLVHALAARARASEPLPEPRAQLVFCIDARSEILRRHLEATGPYETHGYAGFFGIPMRYRGHGDALTVDACPPIVQARHHVEGAPRDPGSRAARALDARLRRARGVRSVLQTLKTNPAAAFSYVEMAGPLYGLSLLARTLLPTWARRFFEDDADARRLCEPRLEPVASRNGDLPAGLTFEDKVAYAATAFDLMGLRTFTRTVVFVGHGARAQNNAFQASLDCGACAGNRGGPNAKVLAAICNDPSVRDALAERGFEIPADTLFLAGEHETTTDAVTLFDDAAPASHAQDLDRLRADLATARTRAAAERATGLGVTPARATRDVERRASDWSETRPEWGLAGHAAFIIGPRSMTAGLDLAGRCFLHSYDPEADEDGHALEAIMTGPLLVTQWINAHYYFATVDNEAYGSGSKVTQNPVGNIGVFQGNGGDLRTGLPRQSVTASPNAPRHAPLRLTVILHAPLDRVDDVLARHDEVARLLDHEWITLTVIPLSPDPQPFTYGGHGVWHPHEAKQRRSAEVLLAEVEAS